MNPETDPALSPDLWHALGWVDKTALAVLGVFLIAGLVRGAGWQLSRIAMLVVAYGTALLAGPALGTAIAGRFPADADPALPLYVGGALSFLGVLVVFVLIGWAIRARRDPEEERPGVPFGSRLSGAALGVVSGGLVALALLTAASLVPATTSLGGSVAAATERSEAAHYGRVVVGATRQLLPSDLRAGADAWDELLAPDIEQASIPELERRRGASEVGEPGPTRSVSPDALPPNTGVPPRGDGDSRGR